MAPLGRMKGCDYRAQKLQVVSFHLTFLFFFQFPVLEIGVSLSRQAAWWGCCPLSNHEEDKANKLKRKLWTGRDDPLCSQQTRHLRNPSSNLNICVCASYFRCTLASLQLHSRAKRPMLWEWPLLQSRKTSRVKGIHNCPQTDSPKLWDCWRLKPGSSTQLGLLWS